LFGSLIALLFGLPGYAKEDLPAWWIAPGGGMAWIPAEWRVDDPKPSFGGILGFRLSPTWALEGRGHFTTSDFDAPGAPTSTTIAPVCTSMASLRSSRTAACPSRSGNCDSRRGAASMSTIFMSVAGSTWSKP
jgi:hypothetical protein